MSTELFDQLEKKVSNALDTIEMLRMEVEELRSENQKLKSERDNDESRLNTILSRFSSLEEQQPSDSNASAEQSEPAQQDNPQHHF